MAPNNKPILVAFEGPPGCGKGTQARLFADRRDDVTVIGVSDSLRILAIENPTEYSWVPLEMAAGKLIPSRVVMLAVSRMLKSAGNARSIILDGIPREVDQAKALVDLARFYEVHVILLNIEDKQCFDRIRNGLRGRPDDTDEIVWNRIQTYRKKESEIKNYLILNTKVAVSVHILSGESHPEQVFNSIHAEVFA